MGKMVIVRDSLLRRLCSQLLVRHPLRTIARLEENEQEKQAWQIRMGIRDMRWINGSDQRISCSK